MTARRRVHVALGTRCAMPRNAWTPTRLASTIAGSRSDMYRLATNAIVRVASPPHTAPISGARTAAAPARRTSTTMPVPPSTVSAGIVAGMLDAQSRVSNVTPPRTVAGPGNVIHGNSESKRIRRAG